MYSVFIVEPFCVWWKNIGIFCYLVNANVVAIATALDFSAI